MHVFTYLRISFFPVRASCIRYPSRIIGPALHQRMESRITKTPDYSTRRQGEFRIAAQIKKGK